MTGIELIGLARISDREHQNTHQCLVVFKDSDYRGEHIFLTEGEYPSLGNYNFNDTISSMWVYPIQGRYRINACDSSGVFQGSCRLSC